MLTEGLESGPPWEPGTDVIAAAGPHPDSCSGVCGIIRGLSALADPGFNPCVTLSQAFDRSVPQFPHT